jgi:transposase-like protein
MVHCPSCGKEVEKPSRTLTNYSFTIEAYNCKKCHHNFKITINHSMYNNLEISVPKT